MIELWQKHSKGVSKFLGVVFIILATSLYFWNNQRTVVVTEEMRAAANVERMEARTRGEKSATKAGDSHSSVLEKLKARQKRQLEILLISMVVFGAGFLAYGFVKRD